MDFNFTEEQIYFKKQAARAIKELIEPYASKIDREDTFPRELFERLGALGYYGIRYPHNIGGMGADCTTFTMFAEELARVSVSFAAIVTMQCLMGTDFIHRFGTEDHIERLLKPAIKGQKVGTIAFTEPDCGSDLGAIKTRAVKDKEGYVIKGRKMWITSAETADFVTVVATVNPEKRLKGLAFFLVEKGMPGFSFGKQEEFMGLRGMPSCDLVFEDVHCVNAGLQGQLGDQFVELLLGQGDLGLGGLTATVLGLPGGEGESGHDNRPDQYGAEDNGA